MNSRTFTPGPWEQDGNAVHTSRGTIAVCPVPQKGGVFDCNANARLIAAAPDLLAALKAVMDEWREGYGLSCVKEVRAAISKAEDHTE